MCKLLLSILVLFAIAVLFWEQQLLALRQFLEIYLLTILLIIT